MVARAFAVVVETTVEDSSGIKASIRLARGLEAMWAWKKGGTKGGKNEGRGTGGGRRSSKVEGRGELKGLERVERLDFCRVNECKGLREGGRCWERERGLFSSKQPIGKGELPPSPLPSLC